MEPIDAETVDAYVDAAARTLRLPIAETHLPGVRENFARIAGLATLLLEAPLSAADEPAPVFLPGDRL